MPGAFPFFKFVIAALLRTVDLSSVVVFTVQPVVIIYWLVWFLSTAARSGERAQQSSKYFKCVAHHLEIFQTRSTPSECFERAAHHLEIFSDQSVYRTTFPLRSPGAFTLYRCWGNYCVILHGMHLGIWEGGGEVNETLPGACPPGHIHAVICKRLTSAIYTQLVDCLLCTLWKGLGVVGD